MNWDKWVRQLHRWLAVIFTVIVIAIFGLQGFGVTPAEWIYLTPLAPLFLLMLSGAYLFVLPYAAKWRRAR